MLALAVGFVVDSTSLSLTISNLTNIIAADTLLHLGFADYARTMLPVNLAVVAVYVAVPRRTHPTEKRVLRHIGLTLDTELRGAERGSRPHPPCP